MPNCVVKGCVNHSSKNKKQDGITFHMFPTRNQDIKEKWIELVRVNRNEPSWIPSLRSAVCSRHFEDDDFYTTKKGLRRVVRNGYPKLLPDAQNLLPDAQNISANMALRETANVYYYAQLPATPVKTEHIEIDEDQIQPRSSQSQPTATTIKSEPIEIVMDPIQLSFSLDQVPATPIKSEPIEIVVNPIQHRFIGAHVPATPIESHNVNQIQPCTVQTHVSTSPSSTSSSPKRNIEEENESIFDTPRKRKLRQRVFRLQNKQKQMKRKIKTLNQKIRRLTKRNKSLKEILKQFKKDSMIILKSNNYKATVSTDIS